jgi:FixJ family two-component response regulator
MFSGETNDLALPRLSGHAVQQEIAANAWQLPVVVVTGDPGDLVETETVCILRKPVDPEALLSTVRRCLRRSK